MTKNDAINSVLKYLELTLSEEGLEFFFSIKKSFEGDNELFYDFLYSYLTIQNGAVPPQEGMLYSNFCIYFSKFFEIQGENKILELIARYAKYYLMLRLEYIDNPDFARSISVINAYEAWDAYPFLLEIMDDYENRRIDDDALLNMLNMVEDMAYKRLQEAKDTDLTSIGMEINKMLYHTKTQARSAS